LRAATIWGVGLTTLLAALVGWWYSRRIASRVRAVAGACEHIISGNLAQRLPRDRSGDEFDQLTVAVNHMLDRVEHQTAVLRTTFGSAAHDLRTPLQRIRTRLESALQTAAPPPALQQPLADAVTDLDRMQRTLSTLLQIANAESGQSGQQFELLDLAQLATEICELYAPVARARQLTLELRCGTSAPLAGNRQLLAQLLVNLLENALKYAPDRSCIVVEVARTTVGVRLSVRDNGPGIPDAQRAEALLPFRRLDPQSALPGSGLGLSLVDAVVRLHHGSLQLADNDPGLAVHCDLPAAA
jgi:signal transduction histidine kinase